MSGSDADTPPPPPPPSQPPVVTPSHTPHTMSTIKLPILKKREYDIWAMKIEHYLAHTDYHIWEVIQKGNGPMGVSTDTNGVVKVRSPCKVSQDVRCKKMLDAIKSRFGGNDESKKMQKYILKQQFEGFSISNLEGLHKGYDRFQSLLSQLEIHGAGVSSEDANQKFLRSLPPSWSQVSLVMRTKLGIDNLSFDDLYNNLRVFESYVKGSTASSSSTQNIAFVSYESTNSTNNISTACGASTSSGCNSQKENSSSNTDEILHSLFANQSNSTKLDHEDLEQLDEFDLEEINLKWQVAMISMRLKKFYKKTRRKLHFNAKEPVGFDKTKVECFNCHKTGHFARECRSKGNHDVRRDAGNSGYKAKDNGRRPGKQEEPKALVTLDGEGIDWTEHADDEQEDFALMAYSNSGSDNEVTSCSKECVESYSKLKKLYDEQREQLGDASIVIQAYTQALKKVEAQLVAHQKNQLWYEEKIRFMKIDLDDKTDVLTYHKKLLAEAVTEKEDLKAKLEQWKNSSKNLGKLLGSQMSANDKFGLGYGDHRFDGNLSYEKEVFQSVFNSTEDDVEDRPLHNRFVKADGMHVVPPPMIYMPTRTDEEIDDSKFTYGKKQSETSETSESDTQTTEYTSCDSDSSKVVNEPKVVCKPKVWTDAPIIEEYKSDSNNDYVPKVSLKQEKPSFANSFVKHVKTPREKVNSHSQSPKRMGLGYGSTKRACFVCGSYSHLIKDCDFHEKIMIKQAEQNKKGFKGTGPRESGPVWNNVQRINHQNNFVPKAVLIRTGKIPVSTARQNFLKQAVPRKVSTARPNFNIVRRNFVSVSPKSTENDVYMRQNIFRKPHSSVRRPFQNKTVTNNMIWRPKANALNENHVNTAGSQAVVNTAKGNLGNAVKSSACWSWDYKQNEFTYRSENNSGSYSYKTFKYVGPQGRPKSAVAWVLKEN
ncbi:ribonuclease H-like domain-containing protein [Tanacetum coccineum]